MLQVVARRRDRLHEAVVVVRTEPGQETPVKCVGLNGIIWIASQYTDLLRLVCGCEIFPSALAKLFCQILPDSSSAKYTAQWYHGTVDISW